MISIDFWDTLVDGKVGGKTRRDIRYRALHKISEEYVSDIPSTKIDAASKEAAQEFNKIWFNQQRTPTAKELVIKILDKLVIPATKEELEYLIEQFEESLLGGPPAILDGAIETISSLSKEHQLTLISDTMYSPGRIIRKFLEEQGLLDHFNAFLFSDEAGYSKPNPMAFQKMLEDTGCKAENSYHIGDRINTDITGAKSVGMSAILFTGISMKDNGSDPVEEAKPDYCCESWKEIEELLL